jgi:hypothetical protein
MALNYTDDFANVSSVNSSNRYLGGSDKTIHPYVKGYFYVFFEFPPIVAKKVGETNANVGGKILLSLCEGFTPPGDRQLKTETVTGMGGLDADFVTGQTLDRSFSLMYRELWGNPIFVYHRAWTGIIDPYLGLNNSGLKFIPKNYKGRVLVIQTKPNIVNSTDSDVQVDVRDSIIKVNLFDGVVPITDLSSVYDSNINDNSIVRPTVSYRFDGKDYDETYDGVLSTAESVLSAHIQVSKRQASIDL